VVNVYTPDEIATYLLEEKLAVHGISPEVYQQNQALIRDLGRAASASSDALIGLQVIGSRSNGTCGLESDVDLIAVTFDTDTASADQNRVLDAAEKLRIPGDIKMAALGHGFRGDIPTDATDFIAWVDEDIERTSILFDEGIFTTPDQRLGRLAVTSLLLTYVTESTIAAQWNNVRATHADAYLGNIGRVREKLVERLGTDQATAIRGAVSNDLMSQRYTKFGLPEDMRAYHDRLQNWAERNRQTLQRRQGWRLLQGVLREA